VKARVPNERPLFLYLRRPLQEQPWSFLSSGSANYVLTAINGIQVNYYHVGRTSVWISGDKLNGCEQYIYIYIYSRETIFRKCMIFCVCVCVCVCVCARARARVRVRVCVVCEIQHLNCFYRVKFKVKFHK